MKRLAVLGWGLLLVGSAFGCSDDSSEPVALEDLVKASSEVSCAKLFDCCTAEERKDLPYESEEACRTTGAAYGPALTRGISESIEAGRVSYDAAAAGRCIDSMRAASCTEYQTGSRTGCDDVLEPLVPVGGACLESSECIAGYCDGTDESVEPPVLGVCEARRENGAECIQDNQCTSDFCDYDLGTCSALHADGEPCSYDDDCASDYCNDEGTCGQPATECTL